MEAVAALSLAANIIQFIDFGTKILSKGSEIYRSSDGSLKDNISVEALVKHLEETLNRLQHLTPNPRPAAKKLRDECTKLITELLDALSKLTVQGRVTKWKSFRKALKSVRSKTQIEQWLKRLQDMRDEYNFELEVDIIESIDLYASDLKGAIGKLDDQQRALAQTVLNALRTDRDNFDAVVAKHAIRVEDLARNLHDDLKAHVGSERQVLQDVTVSEHVKTRGENALQYHSLMTRVSGESEALKHLTSSEHDLTRREIETRTLETRNQISNAQVATVSDVNDYIAHTATVQDNSHLRNLKQAHERTEGVVVAQSDLTTQILTDELELQAFIAEIKNADGEQRIIDFLSHELSQTKSGIRDLNRQLRIQQVMLDFRAARGIRQIKTTSYLRKDYGGNLTEATSLSAQSMKRTYEDSCSTAHIGAFTTESTHWPPANLLSDSDEYEPTPRKQQAPSSSSPAKPSNMSDSTTIEDDSTKTTDKVHVSEPTSSKSEPGPTRPESTQRHTSLLPTITSYVMSTNRKDYISPCEAFDATTLKRYGSFWIYIRIHQWSSPSDLPLDAPKYTAETFTGPSPDSVFIVVRSLRSLKGYVSVLHFKRSDMLVDVQVVAASTEDGEIFWFHDMRFLQDLNSKITGITNAPVGMDKEEKLRESRDSSPRGRNTREARLRQDGPPRPRMLMPDGSARRR